MDIEDIFAAYAKKVTQIYLYERAIKTLAQEELKRLNEYTQMLENAPELKELSSSHHKVLFRDAVTGEHRQLGYRSASIEERQLSVLLHKNKQYQWLLAEAYEEFEDFLEHVYAYVGSVDKDFWPLADYGSASLSELKDKTMDWYLARARSKRDRPQGIINQIRKKRPDICNVESNNALKIDFRLALTLIEQLRHVIVHCGGTVEDRAIFIERVLTAAGLYKNGNPKDDHVALIRSFFGAGEYENTVLLLEIRVMKDIPLDIHVSRFEWLCEWLTSYAFLLAQHCRM